jgi:cAMP-binding proteins - catabolite gene activator and regulatory subunit of cAMP-dependent protein kinases
MTQQSSFHQPNNSFVNAMTLFNVENTDVLSTLKTVSYKKHDYIYLPGEAAQQLFIIKEGRVKIGNHHDLGKEIIKDVLMKGEYFGEASMIGQDSRPDFAVAMENTQLYVLSREKFKELLLKHKDLMHFMIKTLGTRLMKMERRLESFVFKSSRTRIIDFLNELAGKRGQRVGYEMVVRQFFTHQEIANITATSRQTVTMVLNELRNKNILTFNRRRLLIRSLDMLQAEVA